MHWFKGFSQFAAALRRKDQSVFDPKLIAKIERAARDMFPGSNVAESMPVARDTYELSADLLSGNPQTNLVSLDFPGPVDIVGILASLTDLGTPPALPTATADDVRVSLRINEQMYRTVQRSGVATGSNGSTVVLAFLVMPSRVFAERITNSQPKIDVQFSWRRGVGTRRDTAISLAFLTRPIE